MATLHLFRNAVIFSPNRLVPPFVANCSGARHPVKYSLRCFIILPNGAPKGR